MKMMQLIIGMMFMSINLSIAGSYHHIEGVWVNDRYEKKIIIEQTRDELRVTGIYPKYEKGQKFYQVTNHKYKDNFGNLIKIENDGRLEVKYAGTLKKIEFKVISRKIPRVVGLHSNSRSTNSNQNSCSTINLEGTWYNRSLDRDIIIVDDRNGFKAKMRDGNWKYFEKIDHNTYKDSRGNSYKVNRDGSMTWRSYDRSKAFDIVKQTRYSR